MDGMTPTEFAKLLAQFQARRNAVAPNPLLLHFAAPEPTEEPEETPAGDPVQQFIARASAARNRRQKP